MFTLAEDGPRDAVFQAYESIFFNEFDDRPISLQLISNPAIAAEGRVREVAPTIDPRTGTVRVLVGVDGAAEGMGLGAAVLGRAHIAPKQAVILPWSAMDYHAGAPAVWVVDPATRAVARRKVEVEKYEAGAVVLKSGLGDGELVVIEGTKFLHDGLVVALAGAAAK
jgi:multidrug efflux pump subunit AcrA (membrane-fusion protein)